MCANSQSNWLNTMAVRASYIFTYFEAISLVKTKKKKEGGLSPLGKNQNRNRFVFLSFEVDPLNWQSFIEIGEMACSTETCFWVIRIKYRHIIVGWLGNLLHS